MYTRQNAPEKPASKTSSQTRSASGSASTRARSAAAQKPELTEEELAARRAAARKRAAARRKAKERQKQRRIFLLAAGLFLSALVVLVWALVLMIRNRRPEQLVDESPAPTALAATAQPGQTAAAPILPAATTIAKGVSVNGVNLGDMSAQAAQAALAQAFENDLNSLSITLKNDYFNATLTRKDIGAYFDMEEALSAAAAAPGDTALQAAMRYDPDALTAALSALNDQVPGHASNATLSIDYESYTVGKTSYRKPKFVYTPGTNGMQLDTQAVTEQIERALQSGTYQIAFAPEVTVSEPAVTVDTLKKATTRLSSFTTTYYFTGTSSTKQDLLENRQGRDINISLGISKMGVITLKPGETFSFNKATGDRSEKNGWALANAIYNQGYAKEPGGGICQVSTTMYNALLLAGVTDITSHRPHTIPSDYVELGFDATVDYGHIDFKFKNNKKNTIYLFLYITKNKDSSRKKDIHVDVYGMEEPGITYKTRFEIISEDKAVNPEIKYDKKQYPDYQEKVRNAHDGYVVTTYVDMYTNNKNPKTIYTYTATYDKIEEKWIYGSKPTPTPAPTKTPKPTKAPKATATPVPESFEPAE